MLTNKKPPERIINENKPEFSKLSIILSVLFHIFIFVIITIGFTWNKTTFNESVYTVDILPISKNTNIKSKSKDKKSEEDKKEEQKEAPKSKNEEEKEVPTPTKAEPEVNPKKEEEKKEIPEKKKESIPSPNVDKKEEKKEEKKKKEEPKPKPKPKKAKSKDDNFDSLLKTLEKEAKPKNPDKTEFSADKTARGPHSDNLPLSISLEDEIRRQLETCWTPPVGGLDAKNLAVLVHLSLEKDGTVKEVKILKKPNSFNGKMVEAASDAAVRAVHKCSPLKNLPENEYNSWKELEFNFDPNRLVY